MDAVLSPDFSVILPNKNQQSPEQEQTTMGNPQVFFAISFLTLSASLPIMGWERENTRKNAVYKGKSVHTLFLFTPGLCFLLYFLRNQSNNQTDTVDSGTGIVFIQCSISILRKCLWGDKKKRKCLLVHKKFCINRKFFIKIFEKTFITIQKKLEKMARKHQGARHQGINLFSLLLQFPYLYNHLQCSYA